MMENKMRKSTIIVIMALIALLLIGVPATADAASKPAKVKQYSIQRVDHNSLKISWAKAKYAKKYQVYMATKKYGKYKLVKTTTKRSYQKNNLTTGKTYYFKVRAVNGRKYGSFSYKRWTYPRLGTVKNLTVTAKTKGATLKWSGIAGATRYTVAAYNSSGKLMWNRTVSTSSRYGYNVTGLNAGSTYKFKVRARKWANGKYQYGYYSAVKKVTTPSHNFVPTYSETDPTELVGYTCTRCGDTKTHTHSFTVKPDSNNEVEVCTGDANCAFEKPHTHTLVLYNKTVTTQEPEQEPVETTEVWQKCTANGCTFDEKHDHEALDGWHHDDVNNTHYQLCRCGERINEAACDTLGDEATSMAVKETCSWYCTVPVPEGTEGATWFKHSFGEPYWNCFHKYGSYDFFSDEYDDDVAEALLDAGMAEHTNATSHTRYATVTDRCYLAPYQVHTCSVCGEMAQSEVKTYDWQNIIVDDADMLTDFDTIQNSIQNECGTKYWNRIKIINLMVFLTDAEYINNRPLHYQSWTDDPSTWIEAQ